jgi:hydroxymethylpyrimidine pyrophosphatase-like HAD family hydrolase
MTSFWTEFHEPPAIRIEEHGMDSFYNDVQSGKIGIHKMIIMKEPESVLGLRQRILDHPEFPEHHRVIHTQVEMIEAMPPQTSKSNGIRKLCEIEGISMDNVICFGDGSNDYEMIRDSGIGVAMGNGTESIIKIAKHQTLTNDQNGVSHFLRQIFTF